MKALIIAAGDGTRMQPVTRGRHKSLMELLGLKIIERVILGAKVAGIGEFVVVTGYRGNDLRKTVGDGSRYGVSIQYVHNPKWEKANGISVYRAKHFFNENFVLLMSDHVFNPKTLSRIQKVKLGDGESIVAIDKNVESALDVADTTKVIVKKNQVVALNKHLDSYNAFDTGMFMCSPYIFDVLKKTTAKGKNSLSDGMRVLVSEAKLRALDNHGRFWADCDTYEDIKFAEKKLLRALVKGSDGIVAQKLNRKVSTLISKYLVLTSLTPNMISLAILAVASLTFFLLAAGIYPWIFVGGLLIHLLSILDGCDGEVARLKFMKSKWGGFLDATVDKYVDTIVIAGMVWGVWRTTGNSLVWLIAIFVMLGLILDGYIPNKFAVLVGRKLKWSGFRFKRDLRLFVLGVGAMINQIVPAMVVMLALLHYMVIARLFFGRKISEATTKSPQIAKPIHPAKVQKHIGL